MTITNTYPNLRGLKGNGGDEARGWSAAEIERVKYRDSVGRLLV